MNAQLLHTRLAAFAVGAALAACAIAAIWLAFPAQAEQQEGMEYGYVYSGAKAASADFVEANLGGESLVVFGSSEFSTPRKVVPQVPSQVFGTADYGLRLMLVGEAYDQSLWHAMALGALAAKGIPNGKAAIIVTPGWFTDGGLDADTFKTRFSFSHYAAFRANPNVPDEAKSYVQERLAELGIDETTLHAAAPELPQDFLNSAALAALDDFKLRQGLVEVREKGMQLADAPESAEPDFEAMREEAAAMGAEKSTTNDWGLEDAFYTEQLEPVLGDIAGSRADETYGDTPEYDDLDCFLSVADACGVEVLVVLAPECGPYYDHIGISKAVRESCYEHVRAVVGEHGGASIADFSDREYEKYFLYDIVHFGWTGWIDVEQSLYEFAHGRGAAADAGAASGGAGAAEG